MLKWQRGFCLRKRVCIYGTLGIHNNFLLFAPDALYIYNLFGIPANWISKNNNPNNLYLWPNMSKFTLFVKLYIVYYQKNVKIVSFLS